MWNVSPPALVIECLVMDVCNASSRFHSMEGKWSSHPTHACIPSLPPDHNISVVLFFFQNGYLVLNFPISYSTWLAQEQPSPPVSWVCKSNTQNQALPSVKMEYLYCLPAGLRKNITIRKWIMRFDSRRCVSRAETWGEILLIQQVGSQSQFH